MVKSVSEAWGAIRGEKNMRRYVSGTVYILASY